MHEQKCEKHTVLYKIQQISEIQPYPQYSVCVLGNVFRAGDSEDILTTRVEGNFQAFS
jgi:hypothetical protein